MTLTIGTDASVIASSSGGSRIYAIQLLQQIVELRPEWSFILYLRRDGEERQLGDWARRPNVRTQVVGGRPNAWRVQAVLPPRLERDRVDIYHSLGFFLPLRSKVPMVLTVHDLNMYLNWRDWLRSGRVLSWADLALQTPLAVRAADHILTDSEFSRDSIRRILRVAPEKISVIPLAPDEFFDQPPSQPEIDAARALAGGAQFLLHVGVLSPIKNIDRLIEAFAASSLPSQGVRLVLAGADAGFGAALRAIAVRCGVQEQVDFAGFVSKPALRALYHEALAVVAPSHGEGFGLPLVEAMAAGAPVLAANRQSLPEVVGEAGRLFEPDDVGGLAGLLTQIHADPALRAELSRRGRERRKAFSWTSAAQQTLAVYEEALRTSR